MSALYYAATTGVLALMLWDQWKHMTPAKWGIFFVLCVILYGNVLVHTQ